MKKTNKKEYAVINYRDRYVLEVSKEKQSGEDYYEAWLGMKDYGLKRLISSSDEVSFTFGNGIKSFIDYVEHFVLLDAMRAFEDYYIANDLTEEGYISFLKRGF